MRFDRRVVFFLQGTFKRFYSKNVQRTSHLLIPDYKDNSIFNVERLVTGERTPLRAS